jgi:hypothetical protein
VAQGTPANNTGPDQHSPLNRLTPTQGKKEKKQTIINNKKKTHSKEGGAPSVPKRGGAIPHRTVNKQASWRNQEWQPQPRNLGAGNLVTVAVMRKAPLERGEGAIST